MQVPAQERGVKSPRALCEARDIARAMRSLLLAILLVACGKSDSKPAPSAKVATETAPAQPASAQPAPAQPAPAQPAPAPAQPAPAAQPAAAPTLEPGEELVKFNDNKLANPYTLVVGGKTITFTLSMHRHEPKAWTRMRANGVELFRFEDNYAYTHFAFYEPRPDGKLLVMVGNHGDARTAPAANAYLLMTDGDGVKIEHQWTGDPSPDDEPKWANSEQPGFVWD
jgi:hypothetical protein